MAKTLEEVAQDLKDSPKKVQLIYAFNGSGKTRLSREFRLLVDPKNINEDQTEQSFSKIIYYNAFTEDLFYWFNDLDNDLERELRTQPNGFTDWLVTFLEEQGLDQKITDHFQRYTSDKLTPIIAPDFSKITFSINSGSNGPLPNVKISKGEESNFIWSIFYSLLEQIIDERSIPNSSDRSTQDFNDLEYLFIDDPVSSLDDTHLIELAVDIAHLIKSNQTNLKFIITTHNPLFYNVLSNEFNNKYYKNPETDQRECLFRPNESKKFRLDKNADGLFVLDELGDNTPFSYHLFLLSEIKKAIENNDIKKFHFGFLRNILEKTATFLGYTSWTKLLPKDGSGNPDPFANRILNLSNHSAHSGEEVGVVEENDKEKLKELVTYLSSEYKFWQ
jgi:hypothetical protein